MKKDQFSGVPEEAELLDEVEAALFRRATGYEDSSGKPVPPDVRAAMYWLETKSG